MVIDKGTITEKVDAYKLLTLAYIYLEEPDDADKAMLNLLQTEPEFQINEAIDPAEFVALYNTFRTAPIFRFGVKGGGNVTWPNVSAFIPPNDGVAAYSAGVGFQVGFSAEIPINKFLTLNPELNYRQTVIGISNLYFGPDDQTGRLTEGRSSMGWVSMPVSVQYKLSNHRLSPYVGGGLVTDYLVSANKTLETKQPDFSPVPPPGDANERDVFKPLNLSASVCAGLKVKAKKALFITELRYTHGLRNVVNGENLYVTPESTWDHKFVHGLFSLNAFTLSFGYLVNKYSPKKLTP